MQIYEGSINPCKLYSIQKKIGEGAYSIVYSVKHVITGKNYAMKKYKKIFTNNIDTKNIIKELMILRQLESDCFPKIKEIIVNSEEISSCFPFIKTVYLIFEQCEMDFRYFITISSFQKNELKLLMFKLVKAIRNLHNQGVYHRDLKPENIIVNTKNIEIKITDFNHAKLITHENEKHIYNIVPFKIHEQNQETHILGTRYYRAPELLLLQKYDQKIDVWALGCIFLELLSHYFKLEKGPFFDGKYCEVFSPTNKENINSKNVGKRIINKEDQILVILKHIGQLNNSAFDFIKNGQIKSLLKAFNKKNKEEPKINKLFNKVGSDSSLKNLIHKMLVFNPLFRFNVEDCYNHKYFDDVRWSDSESYTLSKVKFNIDIDDPKIFFSTEKLVFALFKELNYYNKLLLFDEIEKYKMNQTF